MIRPLIIITIVSFLCSCRDKPKSNENVNGTTIHQTSNQHGSLGGDSVVLKSKNDESGFYGEIQVFRGGQLIFDYEEKDLEIIGTPENVFVEHRTEKHNGYFYIFKIFGGDGPNSFLIIKTSKDQTSIFGKTDTNSADIFGDIDYDGNFEIGGWTDHCQEDESNKCPDLDLYTVFEVDDNFPIDTSLTTFFKHKIESR